MKITKKKKKIHIKISENIMNLLELIDIFLIKNIQIHLTIYMDSDEIKFVISNPTYINKGRNTELICELLAEYIERYEIVNDNIFDIISWIEIRIISNNIIESIFNYIILNFIRIYLFIITKIKKKKKNE